MNSKLDQAKQKLDIEKKKIFYKELRLKQLEKKNQLNKWIEIGKVAHKANIHEIDVDVLLGAFIEISQLKEEAENIDRWKSKAQVQKESSRLENCVSLIVKFQDQLDKTHNAKMKELNFKWNRFRKEFYGHGNKADIQKSLSGINCVVEEIE